MIKLPAMAFCIGFLTALSGIGPGVMVNAVLLKLDVHPRVATETGQLFGVYVGFRATICMLIYGQIKVDYSFVLNIMTILGTIFGMSIQNMIVERSGGKYQYTVLVMSITVAIVLVSSSSLTIATIIQKHHEGVNILEFKGYCQI